METAKQIFIIYEIALQAERGPRNVIEAEEYSD
jgi:hypothetical protein